MTRLVLAGITIFILLSLILWSVFNKKIPTQTQPTQPVQMMSPSASLYPTQSTTQPIIISPLQKTTIGKTTQNEVQKLTGVSTGELLLDGSVKYSLPSLIPQRPNEIITKDGIAIFERIEPSSDTQLSGFGTISAFTKQYGNPDQVIQGSKFFGPFELTYIYNTKGVAFIGNPYTDEIHEIQVFPPTSIERYKQLYGSDIKEGLPPPEKH